MPGGPAGACGGVRWLVADQLGTPRMVIDQSGSLSGVRRHDYLPFGEEIGAGVGGRSTGQGYSQPDGVRQKFTSAERDGETGLDFMQARYYASAQGRLTSVDPLMASGVASNPKTWNRYAYALNNPLRFIDPTGLSSQDIQFEGKITNACAMGEAGCRPPMLGGITVTATIEPTPVETIASALGTTLSFGGQVVSDTVVGGGKGVYNSVIGVTSLINTPIDAALSPFTDFRFNQASFAEAGTPGEQSAMYGVAAGSLLAGGAGMVGAAGGASRIGAARTAIGYHATTAEAAESILATGFRIPTAAGRLGTGIYVNNTAEGAAAEFLFHRPGINPTLIQVQYPVGRNLFISHPPSGYTFGNLPFTSGANTLTAPSLRAAGTYNTLIRSGATPVRIGP